MAGLGPEDEALSWVMSVTLAGWGTKEVNHEHCLDFLQLNSLIYYTNIQQFGVSF